MMNLQQHLSEKKIEIVKSWFDAVVATYPAETSTFLNKQKAQFANPVGYTLTDGLDHLFDALLKGMMPDTVSRFLDSMVRIRAIQDFNPSESIAFIFQIKKIVRESLGSELRGAPDIAGELVVFESAVDDLALYAFDLYMKCKEKIYDLKANESRNMTFRLLQQAKIIVDNQD